jgi:cytochrome c556
MPKQTFMRTFAFAGLAVLTLSAIAFAQDVVVDPAIATMSNDQLVAARQAAMKEDGMLLRGAGQATGEEAVKIATTVLQNFTNFPALFKEGSITADSHALPIIWEQWDAFDGLFVKGQGVVKEMLTAAQAGDTAAYGTALKTLGGICGECHMTYRAKP